MTDFTKKNDSYEEIEITVGDRLIKVTTYLSVADIYYLCDLPENIQKDNSRKIILRLIKNHIISKADKDVDLSAVLQSDFQKFIAEYVKSDEMLEKQYTESNEIDPETRFVKAAQYAANVWNKQFVKSVHVPNSVVSGIAELNIPDATENLRNSIKMIQPAITAAVQTIQPIAQYFSSIQFNLPDYSQIFSPSLESLIKTIQNLNIPGVTEDDVNKRKDAFEKWGKTGWTMAPNTPFRVFSKLPETKAEADIIMQEYTSDELMKDVFDLLQQTGSISNDDLKEAVDDFKNNRFKSCVMILFSMTDEKLLQMQGSPREHKPWRASGKKAVSILNMKVTEMSDQLLFNLLRNLNVIKAMETMFESGDDFRRQPEVINRNFVDHGMLERYVNKRDCIQVFLMLYNFTTILNAGYFDLQ